MLKLSILQMRWLLMMCSALLAMELVAAAATQLNLLEEPIKVTASVNAADIGSFVSAQIGVHNGPITQLVSTSVHGKSLVEVEKVLKEQVTWHAPYLLVHSSCGGGNAWRCEGEAVFKVMNDSVARLGDLIGDASAVYRGGHFHDTYDKLENHVDGLSHASSPTFGIVLDDIDSILTVNATATWTDNADAWRKRAVYLADHHPDRSWSDADWEDYFSALMNSAVLARYCNRSEELQQLTKAVEPELDAYHRRAFTDALSKVVPLEKPKAWRKPY